MAKKDEVKSTSKGRGLTPKQEKFCQFYIELGNASEAYRQAYNAENMTTGAINTKAKELLKNGPITVRINELQTQHLERHNLTIDGLINDLIEYRDICIGRRPLVITTVMKNVQEGTAQSVNTECFVFEPTGANKAFELLGKHLGMFKDKVDITNSDGSFNPMVIELVAPDFDKQDND